MAVGKFAICDACDFRVNVEDSADYSRQHDSVMVKLQVSEHNVTDWQRRVGEKRVMHLCCPCWSKMQEQAGISSDVGGSLRMDDPDGSD